MPHSLAKPCRYPGCPALTHERYCAGHKREVARAYDATRGTTHERGYGWRWMQLRKAILRRDPVCTWPGCKEPSTDVDHIVAKRKGGTDESHNLRGLCASHHSLKTCKEDGGFQRRIPV